MYIQYVRCSENFPQNIDKTDQKTLSQLSNTLLHLSKVVFSDLSTKDEILKQTIGSTLTKV